jgi:hypothetical protein
MTTNSISDRLAHTLGAAVLAIALLGMTGCGEFFGRDDFTGHVMNKTEAEVLSKVGKPAAVDDSNPESVTWTYKSITYDLANQNKRDSRTLVIFKRDPATGKLKGAEVKFEH